jgi:hypothetical protein
MTFNFAFYHEVARRILENKFDYATIDHYNI